MHQCAQIWTLLTRIRLSLPFGFVVCFNRVWATDFRKSGIDSDSYSVDLLLANSHTAKVQLECYLIQQVLWCLSVHWFFFVFCTIQFNGRKNLEWKWLLLIAGEHRNIQTVKWPFDCLRQSRANFRKKSLVCKQNSLHLHSSCMSILFKTTIVGTFNFAYFRYRAWWWICSSDVKMHRAIDFVISWDI